MTRIATPRTAAPGRAAAGLALAVADANWYTTEHLFGALERPDVATLLLKCVDYYNAWWHAGDPPWRWRRALRQRRPGLWQRELVLPSGWMKRFPVWGMRPIGRSIADWRRQAAPGAPLALVMTYPHYLYLRDQVRPDRLVYLNIDDYSQYWPRCADRVNELERQAVRESDLTVCVSRLRCEQLREAEPGAADRIRHLPHGAPEAFVTGPPAATPDEPPADLAALPRPRFGYVGTLEDRVDWDLLGELADAFPGGSVVLVGKAGAARRGTWQAAYRRCLARPNVHALGWRPQDVVARYNRAFDACLIPYRVDHPFNRVCCPTKIMDSMATGRPIVATDLPECRSYRHLFDVAESPEAFVAAARRIVAAGSDDGRSAARHAWAVANTCGRTADRLLDWLAGPG